MKVLKDRQGGLLKHVLESKAKIAKHIVWNGVDKETLASFKAKMLFFNIVETWCLKLGALTSREAFLVAGLWGRTFLRHVDSWRL